MSSEIWSAEEAQRLGACVTSVRKHLRWNRRAKWLNELMLLYYPVLGSLYVYAEAYGLAAVQFLLTGLFISLYWSTRQREKFWRIVEHHMQRMLVETPSRVVWHTEQLGCLFEEAAKNRTKKDDHGATT